MAAVVGCSASSAYRWKEAWERGGARSLRAKRHPGPAPKLAPPHRARLLAALHRGTRYWGYAPSGWTCPLVRDLIQRLFGVEYHVDYVGTLLHQFGWSPQKPERRARERNERAIARWRRENWPRLKKEPPPAS